MQSEPLSLTSHRPETIFQQLQALLESETYNNCEGLLPGEPCYVLAKKSLPFIIQHLSQQSEDAIAQVSKMNASLL